MLASKPTSGLSLYAMMLLDVLLEGCVRGDDVSSSSANSGIRSIVSKRFLGLLADPRPRTPRGAFIESIRQPGVVQPPLREPLALRSWRLQLAWFHVPDGGSIV